ncbi:MAG: FAD-dependent thymidylate synthase [Candidatus Nomurabacteria bacterium]|jgi:thymidylate synthase ThyX|nr:FAD-dependent thymidylate synthase [Candidatus Nomurabacteria bacterium]
MKVFCYDEFAPEDTAMMQALYSRSAQSVQEHVEKVKTTGSGKFMESFYVGYGHNSIADCGSTTIFIEDVSIFVTKAFQSHSLYSGQETSTRYIDMAKQAISDPVGTALSKQILDNSMDFYVKARPAVEQHIRHQYPRAHTEDEKIYAKAVSARAFDILRGFLPAGIHTQFSWHTNLRQAHDALDVLLHHPLAEVRQAAQQTLAILKAKYPNSFSHKIHTESEEYREYAAQNYSYYHNPATPQFKMSTDIKPADITPYRDLFTKRPPKTLLPHFLLELGLVSFEFQLDYGSFRDIQRHRNGVCRIPLLTTEIGFNNWYLSQLPAAQRAQADKLIADQTAAVAKLDCSPEDRQHYISMGFNTSCKVTYGLPAAIYTIEMRSGRTVHPSLRRVAHQMSHALEQKFPTVKLHSDYSADDWDVRRGSHDIVAK